LFAASVDVYSIFDFSSGLFMWIVVVTHSGLNLELSDQKARGFLV
jgi:hypothetical protein